jgi:outer membrane murein-binding lipoprotein Lpp
MKKEMLKKLVMIMAVAILSLSIMAGCSKKTEDVSSDDASSDQGVVYEAESDVTVDPTGSQDATDDSADAGEDAGAEESGSQQ